MYGLTKEENAFLKKLSTPKKIQDFLDDLPMNHEKNGDTYMSPRRVLQEKKAHCIEGAMLAALALALQGERPLLLDLKVKTSDYDHVVALYKRNGYWGTISKTNHGVLRFRDPIYRTIREVALSYFHEYFLPSSGEKTLVSYSRPLDLSRMKYDWATSEEDLWEVADALDRVRHYSIVPKKNHQYIRRASLIERTVANIPEWEEKNPRT